MIPEMSRVDFVHLSERTHVGEIHRRFDHVIQRSPRLAKNGDQVVQDPIGLFDDSTLDDLAGSGVNRNLAGRLAKMS